MGKISSLFIATAIIIIVIIMRCDLCLIVYIIEIERSVKVFRRYDEYDTCKILLIE
jgi:hypothetical protein